MFYTSWLTRHSSSRTRYFDIAQATLGLTGVLGVASAVIPRIPILQDILGLHDNISGAAGFFGGVILICLYGLQKQAREDAQNILSRLQGVDFRVFSSSDEQILYIASRINSARHSICDVSGSTIGHRIELLQNGHPQIARWMRRY